MNLLWAAIIVAVFAALILYINYRASRKRKQVQQELEDSWGKPKGGYFNFSLLGRYFYNSTRGGTGYFQIVSDKICADLFLDEVFKFVDRTSSKIGQQYLYYKLRAVEGDVAKLQQFDKLAEQFRQNKPLRLQCQLLLKKLDKHESYYLEELLHEEPVKPPKWYPVVYVLSLAVLVLGILSVAFPVLLLFLLPVLIINSVLHFWNKQNIQLYLVAFAEFTNAYQVAARLSEISAVKAHFSDTRFLARLAPFKKKMSLVQLTTASEDDSSGIIYLLAELLKMTFNLETLLFFNLVKDLKIKPEPLDDMFRFIGEVDAAISVASLRDGLQQYCTPEFGAPKQLGIDDLVHPLVTNCVPNSLHLQQKSLLLTGSNMSGKTTFIRAVGINLLLGQTLYTCTASRFAAPFTRIFTSIKIADDLLEEKSYYLEEVTTIKAFIEQAALPEPALFILDEIFKGTNTIERISGGKAILSYLSQGPHLVFVSTHDVELTELLQHTFNLHHFSESVEDDELVFDHKIKPGPLTTRNAIRILELNHYPEAIIADANATIARLGHKNETLLL